LVEAFRPFLKRSLPKHSAEIIMETHSKPVKKGAAVNNIVQSPIATNEICCSRILLTFGRSATLPKIILPTPEVAAIQVTRIPPFSLGSTSFTCCT
jgi:hypothetical protein